MGRCSRITRSARFHRVMVEACAVLACEILDSAHRAHIERRASAFRGISALKARCPLAAGVRISYTGLQRFYLYTCCLSPLHHHTASS